MDTIFAPATAPGRAGVAVVRISGPAAWTAAAALCGALPPPRRAALRRLLWQGEVLDEALVLTFAAGASFTGEPVAELHVHGSRAVLGAVLAALGTLPGLRLAEPGEFTRRAFLAGRLDLAQVEGLADLIDAETAVQRRQAMRVLSGDVGRRAAEWRDAILHVQALVEAGIDFADEDVPSDLQPAILAELDRLIAVLRSEVAASAVAERVRDGFEVAIVGVPNAGKSTLLNQLAGRDAAITSAVAGTTRDVIEVRMDLAGLPVTFLDTAGLRAASDAVEQIGIARTRERSAAADLRVILLDATGAAPPGVVQVAGDIVVRGKADLTGGDGVSGLTGLGVDDLVARIVAELGGRVAGSGLLVRQRQRESVALAVGALEAARNGVVMGERIELVAEELRRAARDLAALIGVVDTEAVLGAIFGRFCIGK